ncbi:MAG: PAS domain-containing sensor histidine kinase [Candidatus Sericytochromatia bacterium]
MPETQSPSEDKLLLEQIESLTQTGSWEVHLDTQEVRWSDGVFRLLGYAPQAFPVSFETASAAIHPDDQERALAHFQEVLTSDIPYQIQKRLIGHGGQIRHVRSRGLLYRNEAGVATKLLGVFQDITDFVEGQLLSKKMELQQILEASLDVICTMDTCGKFVRVSAACEKIWGYRPEEMEGRSYTAFLCPEDLAATADIAQKALAGEPITHFENHYLHKNGRRVPVIWSASWIPDQQLLYCVARDVSEKKQAEAERARSEQKFRALVENSNDAVAIIQPDGSTSYVSPSITRVLGYSEAEAQQLKLFELVHPSDAAGVSARIGVCLQNPGVPVAGHLSRIRHKDGSWRWLEATITNLLHDPVINGIIDNFRDVTEKQELQHLLDTATQFARVGGWEVDFVNQRHSWSPVTCEIHEVPHDFVPNMDQAIGFYRESDQPLVRQYVEAAIQDGTPLDFEMPLITASGKERWVRCIGQAEHLNGTCLRIFGSFQDIHRQKCLELELANTIQELAVSNEELEQFAYVASHDLQEPLRMIDSFLSLLNKRYGDQLDSKAQQYIYFATDGAKRMRQVILALLDFSRVGKHQDKISHFALADLIGETLALKHQLITEKQAQITYTDLPSITWYRTPLLQVLQNLIENALKYAQTDVPPVIQISAQARTGEWEITVQDNGIGIAPEFHDKIFVIFQRLHLKHEYGGTGVGLAIVKKIVEGLGGRIWVESQEGQGSRFVFTLKENPAANSRSSALS